MLTAERLRDVLDYNPETGEFRWKVTLSNRAPAGAKAGCFDKNHSGYILIRVLGRSYPAHRLAWLYVNGEMPNDDIDHINGNRADNRIANLRDVTRVVNLQNRRKGIGRSGLIGAHWFSPANCWQSSIRVNGENIPLGYFKTPEAAHEAYMTAKRELHEGCTI
jgi:hypothetical protein